jgi:hypothetical protein
MVRYVLIGNVTTESCSKIELPFKLATDLARREKPKNIVSTVSPMKIS